MKHNSERLFLNPFEDYSESNLLLIGIAGFVISITISYFGKIVFDGIIQVHVGATSLIAIILGNLSNTVILTFGLFILAKILYKNARFVDILNNILIARIPMLFSGLLVVWMAKLIPMGKTTKDEISFVASLDQSDMLWIAFLALFLLFMMVYFFYLLVVGIRHSINSKKFGHGFLIVVIVFVLDGLALLVYREFFI